MVLCTFKWSGDLFLVPTGSWPDEQRRRRSWKVLLLPRFWEFNLQRLCHREVFQGPPGNHCKHLNVSGNQHCKDSLTKYPQAPVVPIVLGGANYSAFAPNHSFIHVDDFYRYIITLCKLFILNLLSCLNQHKTMYFEFNQWILASCQCIAIAH